MSMSRPALTAALSVLLAAATQQAYAQGRSDGPDRFYDDQAGKDEGGAQVQGSLVSTTFVHKELGTGVVDAMQSSVIDDASPKLRMFTDLRGQLTARRLLGGSWGARVDTRVRMPLPCQFTTRDRTSLPGFDGTFPELTDCRLQSGTYGGSEYDVRELYAERTGGSLGMKFGRQYVPEVAAIKVDGARVQYDLSRRWQVLGFGGLYPSRVSRSVADDYALPALPGVVGAASAYRYPSVYGAIGAAGILPGGNDDATGQTETPRTFISSNGYWRPTSLLDVYHHAVVDFTGAAGAGITNLSVGLNVKPTRSLRVTAGVNRLDTETLNVITQERLEERQDELNLVQNNLEVSRIASQSAHLGVSAAFKERRFEVSAQLSIRQRPDELYLCTNAVLAMGPCDAGNAAATFPASSAAEILLGLVDRRSVGGWRLGATVSQTFGLGDEVFRRSEWLALRVNGTRSFLGDRLNVDADVGYLYSQDAGGDATCANNDLLTCFGQATVNTISGSGTVYYRFSADWYALASAVASLQQFTSAVDSNPAANTMLSGLARVAYRF